MRKHILIGIILFILISFLPLPVTQAIKISLAMVIVMVYWWITKPVDYAVTALLPLVINAIFTISPQKELAAIFFNDLVLILISSNIIILGWMRWKLDRRMAYGFMSFLGHSQVLQLSAWFTLSVLVSAFVPNLIAAVILMPVAYMTSMATDKNSTKLATASVLSIAFGTSIGGMATPLGGAMNLVVMQNITQLITHREVMFITWTINMLPMVVGLWLAGLVYMVYTAKLDNNSDSSTRVYFRQQYKELGTISSEELKLVLLFAAPAVLSFLRPLYEKQFPDVTPGILFLTAALISFFLSSREGRLLEWRHSAANINWNVVFLMAGGMALGKMMGDSGAFTWLARQLTNIGYGSGIIIVLVGLGILVTNLTTNTATCALLIPMAASLLTAIKLDPVPYIYVVTAAANCAFILPSASAGPAMVVSYGIELKDMARSGLGLALVSYAVILLIGWILIKFSYFTI